MKSVRRRLTYANVMSSIAVFFVVAGGTAFAASQLGKESVGTKQLKKEAVSLAKINKAAKTSLKGATGPQGAQGPQGSQGTQGIQGIQGIQGLRGPSNARGTSVEGNEELGVGEGAALAVASVSVPAGKWVLIGETGLTNISGATRSASCSLNAGPEQLGVTRAFDEAAGTQRSTDATVIGSVSLSVPGTVVYKCWASGTGVFTPSSSKPALQAIQVESIS